MLSHEFIRILQSKLSFELNIQQKQLLECLYTFINFKGKREAFILKGYAGTGKSSVIGALVKSQEQLKCKFVLLAPTGRAAKVLSGYSGLPAYTIHKKIYYRNAEGDNNGYTLQQNKHINTVFIVDEASMIGDNNNSTEMFQKRSLLDDLFEYVFSGTDCKIMLVGDSAQLPPVGSDQSPALSKEIISKSFFTQCDSFELTDVVRQAEESGILYNATTLRELIKHDTSTHNFIELGFPDIKHIPGDELEDALNSSYSETGAEETMIICRSNKRANLYNQQVRARIRWQENEISAGDYMMVVKNNYFWLTADSKAGFIANGDIIEILKVGKIEDIYGFRFAQIRFRMIDYPEEKELEAKILLSTIMAESPSLSSADGKKLFENVMADYAHINNRRKQYLELKLNPYYNALQVKFAYAITCHKAQGGQWQNVFIEHGYITDEMINTEFMKWLYTGITRTTHKLYLVNFSEKFVKN
jgi:exodeoxyribonuclease-5